MWFVDAVQNPLQNDIRKLVDNFVTELEALFRQRALATVMTALSSGARPAARPAPAARKVAAKAAPAPKASAQRPPTGRVKAAGKRVRRSPEQLESVANAIADYVAQHPGQRGEQIKAALKLRTNDWALPVKKLLDEGRITAKGEKRSTTYSIKSSKPGSK